MRKAHIKHSRSIERKQQILTAALTCFTEFGYSDTTIQDIQKRSKASSGSIYHHFKGKAELAAAVYLEGLNQYQAGFVEALEAHTDARAGVQAMVAFHLHWVADHTDWARFLFQMRRADFLTAKERGIQEQNKLFISRISSWLTAHIENGELRRLPLDLYPTLIFGPCQEYARFWLAGQMRTELDRAVELLADALWRALRTGDEG